MEKIDVTGSYIRRTDTETPSPVQVLTADDIRRTGATSIADVLNNLTANNQGTLSQGFSGAFAEGACGIALRGLTVGSTLVLLDGHRMAPYPLADDGQRSFVDICNLPLDSIDRVEVLKDGASSTYGSDAIAGVVNVILKKSFKGATVSGEQGWAKGGGAATSHITGMIGYGDIDSDKYNGYLSVEYRHQDPLQLSQRPYLNKLDYTSQGGQNLTPGAYNPTGPSWSNTPASTTGYFVNTNAPTGSPNPFSNYGYLPGCNATAQLNNGCLVNTNWLDIVPPTQNLNILARGTVGLGGDWTGSVTASLFQGEILIDGSPAFINGTNGGYSAAGLSPGPNHTVVASLNNVPTFVAPVLASYGFNPAYFTVGQTYPVNFATGDLGGQDTFVKNDTYRITAEVKGTALGWDIDADWGYTIDVMDVDQTGFPIYSVLQTDLANGTYLPGQNNPASVDNAIAPALYSQNKDSLWFTGAHAGRDIPWFTLPGGKIGFAGGVDFFFRSLQAVPANNSVTAQQATNFAFAEGSQSDWSVFGELQIPVLKMLEIDGSGRFDHYNTYGGEATPKVGFKFTPIQQVALRGTYSQGFRAPNPVESSSSGAGGYYFSAPDPILCASGNKAAPNTYPNQCSIPYVFLTVANPALKPETSISKTLGIILSPLKGHDYTVDWYDITLNHQIYPYSEDTAYTPTAVRGAPQTQPYVNAQGQLTTGTPPVGNLLYFQGPYININSTETKGMEFELKDKFDLGALGTFRSDLMFTHMLHYYFSQPGLATPLTVDLAGTHGPNEISGDTGTPRNRARWNLTYEIGPVEAQVAMNYTSAISVIDPSAGQPTCQSSLNAAAEYGGPFFPTTVPEGACHVASFTDFDAYGSWQIDHHWMVHASIDNFLDRKAPYDLQTYAAPNYNPSLHMAGAVGRFFNIGARYTF